MSLQKSLTEIENGYADAVETFVNDLFEEGGLACLTGVVFYIFAWMPVLLYLIFKFIFVPRRYWPEH
jgi:hypothetical protein